MKLTINCNNFKFGGNTFNKGDVIELDNQTGTVLMNKNNKIIKYVEPTLKIKVEVKKVEVKKVEVKKVEVKKVEVKKVPVAEKKPVKKKSTTRKITDKVKKIFKKSKK